MPIQKYLFFGKYSSNFLASPYYHSSTLGFPEVCEWPALSHIKRENFTKLGRHNILRSKVKTTDYAALDLIEVRRCLLPLF